MEHWIQENGCVQQLTSKWRLFFLSVPVIQTFGTEGRKQNNEPVRGCKKSRRHECQEKVLWLWISCGSHHKRQLYTAMLLVREQWWLDLPSMWLVWWWDWGPQGCEAAQWPRPVPSGRVDGPRPVLGGLYLRKGLRKTGRRAMRC